MFVLATDTEPGSPAYDNGLRDLADPAGDVPAVGDKLRAPIDGAAGAADRLAREHHLPSLTQTVRVKSNPQDFNTIKQNWDRLKNNLASSNASIERNTEATLGAMKRTMDLNSSQGRSAVERSSRQSRKTWH